jgi:radical SAM protein with 4Fe4S-binding SPASM domain
MILRQQTPIFKSILIETRNDCTRRCWYCKFGQERKDESFNELAWPFVEKIVKDLGNIGYKGRISWYCTNEPLLDRRLSHILRLTRQSCPEAFLSLVSNGDLLTEPVYKDLITNGLDALGISVYDNDIYTRVCEINDERLVVLDKRHLTPDELENRAGNIKVKEDSFRDHLYEFRNRECLRPSTMMVINAKGEAILCCSDMYSDVVVGHIMQQSIEEIWYGDILNRYRTELSKHGRNGLAKCRDCSYIGHEPFPYFPFTPLPSTKQPSLITRIFKKLRSQFA